MPITTDALPTELARLRARLVEGWPTLDAAALDAATDRDALVELLAAAGSTRALADALLRELEDDSPRWLHSLEQTLGRLEGRARELGEHIPDALAESARQRVREHPLESVGAAMGLGVILGLLLRGR